MQDIFECKPMEDFRSRFLSPSGVNDRLRKAMSWYKENPDHTDIVDVLHEAFYIIVELDDVTEKLEKLYKERCLELYKFETSPRIYKFPVAVGDMVKSRCIEEDEHGNPVVTLVPWEVKGVAYKDGKYYAIDDSGELYECGTAECIIPEPRKAGTDI